MADSVAGSREHARWLLLILAGAILVAHSLLYNFVTDDAYISFVYSRNFAEHGELAFNLGDPVEGYTNFSWTVLLGLLMKVGLPPEIMSRVLGTICALATLYVVTRTMDRALGRRSLWSVVPALLLACSSGFACWTSGGLETQLYTLLVAISLDAVVAATANPIALRRAAIALAFAAMTRPEGPMIAAVLGVMWIVHRWFARESAVGLAPAIARATKPKREDSNTSPPAMRVAGTACALVAIGVLAGGVVLAGRFSALAGALDVPSIFAVAIVGLAIGVGGVCVVDGVRAARGNVRALKSAGGFLAGVGIVLMVGAVNSDLARRLDDVVTWNRAVPLALFAIAAGAAALGQWVAIANPAPRIRAEVLASLWFLGIWLPWFLWRWWYYGWPFPNTYYVKAAGPWTNPDYASQMRDHGLYYVWVWLVQTRLVFAAPLALLGMITFLPRCSRPRFLLSKTCLALLVVYLGYTVTVGGDFMGLHRFIMPLFVVAAIAVVLGLEWLARRLPEEQTVFPASLPSLGAVILLGGALIAFAAMTLPDAWQHAGDFWGDARWRLPPLVVAAVAACLVRGRASRRGLSVAACVLLVGGFATSQAFLTSRSLDPRNLPADRGVIDTPAFLVAYTEDRAKIGRAMESCFRDTDFSIVGGAGAQPYFGRMRGIDVFGLVSDKIAHREPRSRPRAGHTKWGNDVLLAEYDPDFVFSCYHIHAKPTPPPLTCGAFWLRRGFEQVTVHVPGLVERGEYYTFLAKKARNFQCPGRVR